MSCWRRSRVEATSSPSPNVGFFNKFRMHPSAICTQPLAILAICVLASIDARVAPTGYIIIRLEWRCNCNEFKYSLKGGHGARSYRSVWLAMRGLCVGVFGVCSVATGISFRTRPQPGVPGGWNREQHDNRNSCERRWDSRVACWREIPHTRWPSRRPECMHW